MEILDPAGLSEADAELLTQADWAAARAYAPYSGFHVGAAARTRSGHVYGGCNVENAAYPLSSCAERTALSRAVVEGAAGPGDVEAVAITASPCGGCRQWLAEFHVERVLYRREDGTVARCAPSELLPDTFTL